ncbi:hypothetical protein [Gordonia sp. MMO-8]|uniref:hypothetical protein n=1 Tax=Gordonia sp. MMO-8 TaxID=3127886 RepID=UPI003016DDBD
MSGVDPEGSNRGPDGCICGPIYHYAGHEEPGQYAPDCPYHQLPDVEPTSNFQGTLESDDVVSRARAALDGITPGLLFAASPALVRDLVAKIERLTAERDELRAEVERLEADADTGFRQRMGEHELRAERDAVRRAIDAALPDVTIRSEGDTARAVAHLAAERDQSRAQRDEVRAAVDRVRKLAQDMRSTLGLVVPGWVGNCIDRALDGEADRA